MRANCTLQGLLKEQLELEKIKSKDGRVRFTLKPIEDQLTFDKVGAHRSATHTQSVPTTTFVAQGFYVFIRALQLLKSNNEGVVVVRLRTACMSPQREPTAPTCTAGWPGWCFWIGQDGVLGEGEELHTRCVKAYCVGLARTWQPCHNRRRGAHFHGQLQRRQQAD
jgi:hypothetical protein